LIGDSFGYPDEALEVIGNIKLTGTLISDSITPDSYLAVLGDAEVSGNLIVNSIDVQKSSSPYLKLSSTGGSSGEGILSYEGVFNFDKSVTIQNGYYIKLSHANQLDANDGKIVSATFGEGLNIVGTQTIVDNGRVISMWGNVILNDGGLELGGVLNANYIDAYDLNVNYLEVIYGINCGGLTINYTPVMRWRGVYATDPTDPMDGDVYFNNSGDGHIRIYDAASGIWKEDY
jgi:hypothetical protein